MTYSTIRKTVLLLPILLLSGCELPLDGGGSREVGVVTAEHLDPPYLAVPESAAPGTSFQVTLSHGGPHGCYAADGVRTQTIPGGVRITPYHRVRRGTCTQAPVLLQQTVSLTAGAAGVVKVEIFARGALAGEDPGVVAVREVVVR